MSSRLPHILYLEDSILSQKLMVRCLSDLARVVCCATSAEAKAAVAGERFDLVVADYQLVGEDAAAFIAEVRRRFRHVELPILAVSSAMDRVLRGVVFRAGATAALPKPFVADELKAMVARLLSDPRPVWEDYLEEVPTIAWCAGGFHHQYAPHLQLLRSGCTAEEAHQLMHAALAAWLQAAPLPLMGPIASTVHHFAPGPLPAAVALSQ